MANEKSKNQIEIKQNTKFYIISDSIWELLRNSYKAMLELEYENSCIKAKIRKNITDGTYTDVEIINFEKVKNTILIQQIKKEKTTPVKENQEKKENFENEKRKTLRADSSSLDISYDSSSVQNDNEKSNNFIQNQPDLNPTPDFARKINSIDLEIPENSNKNLENLPEKIMEKPKEILPENKPKNYELQIMMKAEKSGSNSDSNESEESEEAEEIWTGNRIAPPIGLVNFGANCYINAGLQCLLSLPEMNGYFIEEWHNKIGYPTVSKTRKVCKQMSQFYQEVFNINPYSKSKKSIRPNSFVGMCPSGQQDVHEFFFKRLFPFIQDETNPAKKMTRKDGWDRKKSWKWYTMYNKSILDMLLGGQFEGKVICGTCGNVSITYDPFLGISLTLSHDNLIECLKNEFTPIEMSKKEGYCCEKCKTITHITKSTMIDRPPKYLIIHLKRLVNSKEKISTFIKYPLILTLDEFMAHKKKKMPKYYLHAICVHSGGASGGHYYAAGKRGEKVFFKLCLFI